jgi:hypothetical protein
MVRSTFAKAAGAVMLSTLASAPARAQTVTLDEGSFRVSVGGREAGTETFSIRKNGTGPEAVIIARGRIAVDAQETTSSAQLAGETLRPAAYDITVQGGDGQKIAGRVVGGRFSARIVSSAGENMREYLVSDGAILVDEGIAHHYYFLVRRLDSGPARVPLLIPRESRQVWAAVAVQGTESVTIGGESISARRISVTPEGGAERMLWADSEGRILRVRVPSRQYAAERTAAPK